MEEVEVVPDMEVAEDEEAVDMEVGVEVSHFAPFETLFHR